MAEDNYKDKRVVWVLGSGFSRSLGGPLLDDLLSERGQAEGKHRLGGVFGNIHDFYWDRLRGHPKQRSPVFWRNAEEFLDFLECAIEGGSAQRALLADSEPEALHRAAVLAVAAECLFDTGASEEAEAWQPYVDWTKNRLKRGDTIITFNYDFVLDMLTGWNPDLPFRFPEPYRGKFSLEANVINVLKLHGSINWFREGVVYGRDNVVAALSTGKVPLLGTPGPSKRKLSRTQFQPLWDAGTEALKGADVIVFMGYRFPPSDSQARSVLLGAIKANERSNLRIHTVLGPRTQDDDTVRLLKLVEHTLRGAGRIKVGEIRDPRAEPRLLEIVSQPLYVEDFLTVLHPRELYGEVQQGIVLTGREGADLAFEKQAHYFHVLDTDPDLRVAAMTPGGGVSSEYRPEPTEQASRLNSREMTVWCDFELHNRSAQLLRNVGIELEFGDARVEVEGAPNPNVIVNPVEELPGAGRIFQSVRQINPWVVEKLATLCIRPYGSARPNEVAESHGKFVISGEEGIISTGRVVVRCKVGQKLELTLRQAFDLRH